MVAQAAANVIRAPGVSRQCSRIRGLDLGPATTAGNRRGQTLSVGWTRAALVTPKAAGCVTSGYLTCGGVTRP